MQKTFEVRHNVSGGEFDAIDALSLFNKRLETALEKQNSAILGEIQDKFKSPSNPDFRGEGSKIQFTFNQNRLRGLDNLSPQKNCLQGISVPQLNC